MKKADGIIIAVTLLVAVLFLAMAWGRGNGQTVVLYNGETEIGRYPLMYERTIRVELEDGYNIVVISDGTVAVSEADCANQRCVHTPVIAQMGETIVCLPHRFYVAIK